MTTKNLSLATVKQKSKLMDQTQVHVIENGLYQGEQITFTVLFNDKSIEELLTEFGQLLNEANEKKIEVSQQMQIHLLYILIIKHFTHFKKDIPSILLGKGKSAGMLDTLDHFHKTGLLNECISSMFLPAEVNKVFNKLTDVAATSLLAMDLNEEMMKKMEQMKIKNKEVFEQLEQINVENNAQ